MIKNLIYIYIWFSMGIDHSYRTVCAQERGRGLIARLAICDLRSTMMQVLRSPYGEDSWLYLVLSVFLWLWTIDFTHGVLKGEEICNRRCVHKEESHSTDTVPGNLNWTTGSPCSLHDVMMIPLPKYMAVNLEFID